MAKVLYVLSSFLFHSGVAMDNMELPMMATEANSGVRALVIGGGPAGLAASLGLAKCCDQVVVVERNPSFDISGSNIGVMPNGGRALDELNGSIMGRMKQSGLMVRENVVLMPWWEMRDSILEQVRKVPNIQVINGECFQDFVDDPKDTDVKANFESGLTLSGDFLVGADGVHSNVRKCLGLTPAAKTGTTAFRGSCLVTSGCSKGLQDLLDGGFYPLGQIGVEGLYVMLFNFHSKTPGRLAWSVSTTRPVDDSTTPISLVEKLIENPEQVELLREIFELSDPKCLKPFPGTKIIEDIENWGGSGRVTLIGDAAHAMRPTDGQGGNQAFEDAVVLSRTLVAKEITGHKKETAIPSALREFEEIRLPRVQKIHKDQKLRYEKRMRGETLSPPSQEYVEWLNKGV